MTWIRRKLESIGAAIVVLAYLIWDTLKKPRRGK